MLNPADVLLIAWRPEKSPVVAGIPNYKPDLQPWRSRVTFYTSLTLACVPASNYECSVNRRWWVNCAHTHMRTHWFLVADIILSTDFLTTSQNAPVPCVWNHNNERNRNRGFSKRMKTAISSPPLASNTQSMKDRMTCRNGGSGLWGDGERHQVEVSIRMARKRRQWLETTETCGFRDAMSHWPWHGAWLQPRVWRGARGRGTVEAKRSTDFDRLGSCQGLGDWKRYAIFWKTEKRHQYCCVIWSGEKKLGN